MNPENAPVNNAVQPEDESQSPTVSEVTPISPELNQPVDVTTAKKGSIAFKILSIVLLVTLIIVGFGVGFMISFGSCFKSDCSPVASGAPIWIPVATLFLTVPLVVKAFKKH